MTIVFIIIIVFIFVIVIIIIVVIITITIIIMNSFPSRSSSSSFVSFISLRLVPGITHTRHLPCCVDHSFSCNRQLFYLLVGCHPELFFYNFRPLCLPRKVNITSFIEELLPISQQNNIPVFSPALTDGALGDTLYFHSYKNPGLVIDIVEGEYLVRYQL